MRPMMWFRSDLRVDDNPALHHAALAATRGLVAVFVLTPEQWREHGVGANQVEFFLRSVADLADELQQLRISLRIVEAARFADVPAALDELARAQHCDALYFNREYELNERRRDDAVSRRFAEAGRPVHAFVDQVIFEPGRIRTNTGDYYTVFTPFKRKWYETFKNGDPPVALSRPKPLPEALGQPDRVPTRLDGFAAGIGPDEWPAGARAAQRRLRAFVCDGLEGYAQQRDLPAVDGTSRLSPYLHVGAISQRQCLIAAAEANDHRVDTGRTGPVTWISELIWREFYRHILVGFPRVSMNRAFQRETERLEWDGDEQMFAAWCAGQTGVPIVDAAMRQLNTIGWMHNRLRMIVASYLTKDLFVHWQRGEAYFMAKLVDGDLASNNGGWQWAASTGTDAQPYFRIFNPTSQSRKFDPDGTFIRKYVPELRDVANALIHAPFEKPDRLVRKPAYPAPIVDHAAARARTLAAFKRLKQLR